MANTAINHEAVSSNPFSGLLAKVADRIARRREFNRTVRELSELDGRTLADLGISRAQIRSVAYESVYLRG